MSVFMVDVETDGPIPGDFSMIQIGAVLVREPLVEAPTFFGKLGPISVRYQSEALKVVGVTREETLTYDNPSDVMLRFTRWVQDHNRGKLVQFISDNNGFDFMFTAWYLQHFTDSCIFGHSSINLGSLYKGMVGSMFKNFKHLRKTRHTHNPVDDAMGNAEALIEMKRMGLDIILE
jgi:hypothetical protein